MTTNEKAIDECQIRQLIDNWSKALRAKDIAGLMTSYTSDIMLFDLAPPLRYVGIDAYQQNLEEWFQSFRGAVGYDISNLSITVGDDVAFSHSLNRITGVRTGGERTDVWVRATVGYRKLGGKWKIIHEHFSTPFEMTPPYKASLDLKP
jgi:uncharacterized protein (TIGR02246 family)